MGNKLVSHVFAIALWLHHGALAARPCDGASSAGFQYRLGDVRYDGPDPVKKNGLATIAASLQSNTQTPLYECVAQWPESWAGWFEGGSNLVWADCIFTGAGFGQDETVSFAVDWKNGTMYLAHTFSCSDREGSQGLATGSINLDFNCTDAGGSSFCVPKGPSTGGRPTLNIATKISATTGSGASTCTDKDQYQSWRLESWLRRIEMDPGASPVDPNILSDSGPSFTLRSLIDGAVSACQTSGQRDGLFAGSCQLEPKDATTSTSITFTFDPKLDILVISEHTECAGGSSLDATGVFYMQAACGRDYNSNQFTCTSGPVWVGTGLV